MGRPNRKLLIFAVIVVIFLGTGVIQAAAQEVAPANATVAISLDEAIRRAQQNEPSFANAVAAQKSATIDRYLAKAALLPSVTYHNQVLYTQPYGQTNQGGQVGVQSSPVFIANNAVHEYTSQASINETVGLKQFADARIASANAARSSAELEIARRGLIAAVVSLYYSVSASEMKQHLVAEAFQEAQTFTDLTQKREVAREVAHADVVKAQLQQQQRQRDLSDATLAAEKARLELAVLLFPDPRNPYSTEAPGAAAQLPTRDEVNRLASTSNPEIRSALADVQASNAQVTSARAAYLPDLALNLSYGIDAPQFAKRGPDDVRNLGYSISGTLDIPVWDWFSTQKRVKQSEIRRDVAKVALTASQRRFIATLDEAYDEAAESQNQRDLLDESVQTAAESLRLTKLRYSNGESTALEVVDAQNSYLSAETAQADGIVRYQTALAGLQILTGAL
ncbi:MULTISPECIES: TolC family protein [Acidobacteriaceae]|uniref:TolC family protein n=1 Tax=Acidobacteriaceae TaxID=204434 RepID=UPI00131B0397|nr:MULTISPECIES: TolC family protein [Acidobacteriaceae]MDW5265979.1 TolC family protein [Edaphobacter sp.]